jgi:AraC family transcriptional regulator of arabinose operon
MLQNQETPCPTYATLVTGHFVEDARYFCHRSRGTQDWLLMYTVGGAGLCGHAGGSVTVGEGDIVIYQPGTPQDYGTDPGAGRWEIVWTHFLPRPAWHEWLLWPEGVPGVMHLHLAEPVIHRKVLNSLQEMHRFATGALRQKDTFAMNALEAALLWCDTQNPRSAQAQLDGRVRDAMDFMCHHLGEAMSIERLAEMAGLSESRFAHVFRKQTGVTPLQFLEQQRLDRARQLLELTSRPIQAIAEEVGFGQPFYFTLRFKRLTGLSPRDYRKRALGGDGA